jgi:cryptochrome
VAFPKKYDPEGAFVKKYIPALRNMPAKYIYEPWKAPIATQKEAGCRIGEDYPKPIVAHEVVSKENMGRMKAAYDAHKDGGEVDNNVSGHDGGGDGDGKTAAKKGTKRSAADVKTDGRKIDGQKSAAAADFFTAKKTKKE